MQNKKILTLDDLVKFCEAHKLHSFNANDEGYKLRVQAPATFEMKDNEESSSTLFGYIQVMHTGTNRNKSNLTEKAAKECMATLAYKPLLANFCEIDGVKDFTSHDFTINDDGEIEYQEHQIGCFTADKPYMKDDENVEGRKNIFAKVAIPREYSDAAEIVERKNGTKVSVELEINQMSFDSKTKELLLESAEVIGCTCLGVDPESGEEVQEGMQGAHIQLEDFSATNNSIQFELKQIIQDSIKEAFDNINPVRKEEPENMEFEENVEVTETSEEEIVVEEMASADEVVEETETTESTEEVTETEAMSEESENEEVAPSEEDFAEFSVTINGEKKTFSVSLKDKLNALFTLVNETYGEADNDFYDIDADEDSKEVYMSGWCSGRHFKQKYAVKKDVFTLQGDRTECFVKLLTEDEIKQLESMKANYAEISDKLAKYEAEPEKISILESADYSSIAETEEFVAFKVQDAHFDLSVDEVRAKADEMLLNAAKAGKVDFSKKESEDSKKEIGFKQIPISTKDKKSGRYGSMFSK